MTDKCTYESKGNSVHVFINGVLHIGFNRSEFKAIQAYKSGREAGTFRIDLYLVSDSVSWDIELEYDNQELAKEINSILIKFI